MVYLLVLLFVISVFVPTNEQKYGRSDNEKYICRCGMSPKPSERIVGGVDAVNHEFPWHVALLTSTGKMYCGGTLLNDLYVVTAAHCVADINTEISVLLGEHYYDYVSPLRLPVSKKIIHPKYSAKEFFNDIALLRLSQRVIFTRHIHPPCLPKPGLKYEGLLATVIGWGYTSESGGFPTVLQKVQMPIIPLEKCRKVYGADEILNSMLCASWPRGKQDSCTGDSGGPLLLDMHSRWHLIGIVSFGHGCARAEYPATYTRIDRFLNWMHANSGDGRKCEH